VAGDRIVEPGEISVAIGGASDSLPLHGSFTLTGPQRIAGPGRVLVHACVGSRPPRLTSIPGGGAIAEGSKGARLTI